MGKGVPTAWGRGKENELLGLERTGPVRRSGRRFKRFNSGSIVSRSNWSDQIETVIGRRSNQPVQSNLIFKTMFLTTFHIYLINLILKNYYHFTLNFFIYNFNFKCLYFKILNIILLKNGYNIKK